MFVTFYFSIIFSYFISFEKKPIVFVFVCFFLLCGKCENKILQKTEISSTIFSHLLNTLAAKKKILSDYKNHLTM